MIELSWWAYALLALAAYLFGWGSGYLFGIASGYKAGYEACRDWNAWRTPDRGA